LSFAICAATVIANVFSGKPGMTIGSQVWRPLPRENHAAIAALPGDVDAQDDRRKFVEPRFENRFVAAIASSIEISVFVPEAVKSQSISCRNSSPSGRADALDFGRRSRRPCRSRCRAGKPFRIRDRPVVNLRKRLMPFGVPMKSAQPLPIGQHRPDDLTPQLRFDLRDFVDDDAVEVIAADRVGLDRRP
jgi:hypothetical protein